MDVVAALIVLAILAFALFLLSQPFWPGHEERIEHADELRRADLEAAKVAKYREIRDSELDHQTGKLSDADWRPIDRRLRAEAVAILDELESLGEPVAAGTGPDAEPNARL